MPLLPFLLQAAVISLTGVMSPGPVTAVAVGKGSESPHAGVLVALGHGIVEFPLIALVFWGFGRVVDAVYIKTAIALVGGLVLLWMGLDMLRSVKRPSVVTGRRDRFPLVAGVLLSAGNPYLLIWWLTAGAALISRSAEYGVWGVLALAITHWLCDVTWCYFLSALAFRGKQFFGNKFQETVFVVSGVFLVFFGGTYVVDAVKVFFV